MSERYIRLFSLPNNLYIDNAPVVVAAGALLKDTKTDKILVQLKIKNIEKKKIKAATVKIVLQDTAGRVIGDTIEHQYLDLAVKANDYFGEQEPIIITEQNARAYSVSVSEIVFEDNSFWNGENKNWEEKIKLIPLSEKLQDKELIKQYQNSLFGLAEVKYVPYQENDLWVCTCGNINRIEQEKCLSCGNTLISLQENLDEEKLREAVNNRLKAEKEKAEAEQKKKAEEQIKRKATTVAITRKLIIVLIAAVCIALGGKIVSDSIEKSNAYKEAVALMESKDYQGAVVIFKELGNYKDSEEKIAAVYELQYNDAIKLLEQKQYSKAENLFSQLLEIHNGTYKDALSYYSESVYQQGNSAFENENYIGALRFYGIVKDYKDCINKIDELKKLTDNVVKQLLDANKHHESKNYVEALYEVRDDASIPVAYHNARVNEEVSIEKALSYYAELPENYLDTKERVAWLEPYKKYERLYGRYDKEKNAGYASNPGQLGDVVIFVKDAEFYAYVVHPNLAGVLKQSDKKGYDYYWVDVWGGDKYYISEKELYAIYDDGRESYMIP